MRFYNYPHPQPLSEGEGSNITHAHLLQITSFPVMTTLPEKLVKERRLINTVKQNSNFTLNNKK
jgi:hypothetical protein